MILSARVAPPKRGVPICLRRAQGLEGGGAVQEPSIDRLRANAVGLPQALVMSIATMAPIAAIFFNTIPASGVAGAAMPLSFVFALIAALFVANAVVRFSRELASAGSFYTYVSQGLGASVGFYTGWVFLLFYGLVAPFIFSIFGATLSSVLQQMTGVAIPWPVFYILATGVVFTLSYLGIRQSLNLDLTFLFYELGVALALAATIIFRLGSHFFTAVPFSFSSSPTGAGGVFFGMVFAILSFIGFEASATLGEETRDPRRNIPRAVFGAVVLIGIFYVFMAYVATVGYGIHAMRSFAQNPNPFSTIAIRYWGPTASYLVDIAGVIGLFACALAGNNASIRVMYAIGREGFLSPKLGKTHPVFKTPTTAIYVQTTFTLVVGIALAAWLGPITAYGFLGVMAVLTAVVVYALVNIALIRFMLVKRRQHFRLFGHFVLPVLAVGALALPVYGTVVPFPAWPLNLTVFLTLAWLAAGGVVLWRLKVTRPEEVAQAGRLMAEGAE
jgi:amino acid transporter